MREKKKIIIFDNEKLKFAIFHDLDNKTLYVGLDNAKTGEYYIDLTVNIPMLFADNNQAYIDPFAKDIGLVTFLEDKGLIKTIHGERQYNMGRYPLVTFNMEALREYSPMSVDKYCRSISSDNTIDFNRIAEGEYNLKTKSGNFLHFHENEDGYDFTYYDKDLNEIDGGILEAKYYKTIENTLKGIKRLLARPDLDKNLKELTDINSLELLSCSIDDLITEKELEEVSSKIKI